MATTLGDLSVTTTLTSGGSGVTPDGNIAITGTLAVVQDTTLTAGLIANGGIKLPTQVISVPDVINVKSGLVLLTDANEENIWLADPVPTTDDGKILIIFTTTAKAHILYMSKYGLNGAGTGADVGTFTAAVGNGVVLVAYQGFWYEVPALKLNVTFA